MRARINIREVGLIIYIIAFHTKQNNVFSNKQLSFVLFCFYLDLITVIDICRPIKVFVVALSMIIDSLLYTSPLLIISTILTSFRVLLFFLPIHIINAGCLLHRDRRCPFNSSQMFAHLLTTLHYLP